MLLLLAITIIIIITVKVYFDLEILACRINITKKITTLHIADQSAVLTVSYSEITSWLNRRPVAVAGPSRVALPQADPNTD